MEATLDPSEVREWKYHSQQIKTKLTWLPSLPIKWSALRLKYLTNDQFQYGANEPGGGQISDAPRFVRITDIDEQGNLRDETHCTLDRELAQPYLLQKGDMLFARSGATVGKSFMYRESWGEACYAGYLIRFRPRLDRVLPEFVNYFTSSKQYWGWIAEQQLQATIQNVSADKYANLWLPVPPLCEQQAIAAFLGRETARIDALIARKQRLIELLDEKRHSIISYAVTKGLDPKAKMKNSGVEWIGEIPEHWTVPPVASFCNIVRGASPRPAGDPEFFNGTDTPWITVAETTKDNEKYLTETSEHLTAEGRKRSRFLEVDTFILTNSGATLGVPKILRISGCINDGSVAFLNIDRRISKDFLYYYFTSQTADIRIRMNQGMGQPNLNTNIVSRMPVPCPPQNEQVLIAHYLDAACDRLQSQVKAIRDSIELMNEYRTALISAAVTGQIDVREEVEVDG